MKPNDEQVLAIKQYLKKHLKYSQTTDEIFDHIVTALEQVPDEISFGEAMNGVIADIGGLRGIALIERSAKWAAIRAMLRVYLNTLKQVCQSPFVIVIAACTVAAFYLTNRYMSNHSEWFILMIILINAPSFVIKKNIFRAPNLVNVKNDAFRVIFSVFQMLTPGIMLVSVLVLRFLTEDAILTLLPYIVSITFCITFLQGSVFYKITRNEFRLKLSDR